jgi:DNA-binding MarR family transcriptional regulator
MTQLYDRLFEPTGLTVSQFGLLAHLYAVSSAERQPLSVGVLAERMGMDPTTLNRNLKPLAAQGLVSVAIAREDRRARAIRITKKGCAKLLAAVPSWRRAQARIREALGSETLADLNGILDLSTAKLAD